MQRSGIRVRSILSVVPVCALLVASLLFVGAFATLGDAGEFPPLACEGCSGPYSAWIAAENALWDSTDDDEVDALVTAAMLAEFRYEECVATGGCATGEPDSDGDGVPDSVDDCPGTPAGLVVDDSGCHEEMRVDAIQPKLFDAFNPIPMHMTIEGHIRTMADHRPIEGVRISTYLVDEGPESYEWYLELGPTNSDGYYLDGFPLATIPPGYYSLHIVASKTGYLNAIAMIGKITIGEVEDYWDLDCDDGDPCTVDINTNPGIPSAGCEHQPMVSCLDDDGCCPPGCDYTTDSDCARPSNIQAWNVLHDATKSAIEKAKERIHALDDSQAPSQELEEALEIIDQGIEELNSGIEALDEHTEDQAQQLLIEELQTKNEILEAELRLAKNMCDLLSFKHAIQMIELETKEGTIRTKDNEMAAMQISYLDSVLTVAADASTECEIVELAEDSMVARLKKGAVGVFKLAKDAALEWAEFTDPFGHREKLINFWLSTFNAEVISSHTKFEVSYDPASRITTVTVFEDSVTVESLKTDEPEMTVSAGQRIEIDDDGFSPKLELTQDDLLSLADRYAVAFGGINPLLIGTTDNPPTASFALMPQDPEAGDTVVVASTSADPDGDVLTMSWYLNGKRLLELDNQPNWEWEDVEAGEHILALEIDDGRGGSDEYSMAVTVVGVGEEAETSSGSNSSMLYLLAIPVVAAVVVLISRSRKKK